MWNQLKKLPPILVGQCILNYLDLKSIVWLETALSSTELFQDFRSFLFYLSKTEVEVHIPKETTKLKWFQDHDFPITKVIVHLDKLNDTFETKMINEIKMVDNDCIITSSALNYLPDSVFKKISSVCFMKQQEEKLMEELFSHLHNLRELTVSCKPDGWILSALRGLYRGSNKNILIEDICIYAFDVVDGSVAEIAKYCPKLQSISVRLNIAEDSLLALSTYCPLLKELDILRIPRMFTIQPTIQCISVLTCIHSIWTPDILLDTTEASNYAMSIPYLTELQEVIAVGTIDHVLLPLIAQYCLKLESVGIDDASTTTPQQLLQLTQNCHHLHSIYLFKLNLCNDELIMKIAKHCPNLKKLYLGSYANFHSVTDSSLVALSEHCPQLYELEFHSCILITEAVVLQLIHNCKKLYILRIPLTCLSEDTVLTLPVTAIKTTTALTLTFDKDSSNLYTSTSENNVASMYKT